MRVYRPTYTIPRPPGCKILERASGKFAKFTRKGQELVAPLTKSGKRVTLEVEHYVVEFRDHQDILRRLTAFTDEASSQRLARTVEDLLNVKGSGGHIDSDLQRRLEGLPPAVRTTLATWGLLDERASMATRPLPELIELYIASMKAAEREVKYVSKTRYDLLQAFEACGFRLFSDINADKLADYLRQRREKGISFRRSNAILMACKCFTNWAVGSDFVSKSPLRGKKVKLLDVEKDRRLIRRALEIEELRRLFAVTAASEAVHHNMTGPERAMLYRLVAESGMRRGELRKAKVSAFDLDKQIITLDASITKSGKERVIPMTAKTAAALRQYFQSQHKLPTAKAFTICFKTAEMIREDLQAAGIAYVDDAGHVFDFHSLRGQCATLLIEAGVEPKVVQEILGHSDIRLTLQTYAKVLKAKSKKQAAIDAAGGLIDKVG